MRASVTALPRPTSRAPETLDPGAGARSPGRRFVETGDGRRIAYVEAGSGPALVLIHGTLMTLEDMWLGPMAALAAHFRVVAVDRPGQGESDRPRLEDASLWRQAATLREAAARLGLDRPILVGHSFGGALALAWAIAAPEEVRGVVPIAPICFPEPRLEHLVFGPRAAPLAGDLLGAGLCAFADPLLLPVLWRAMFLPQPMPQRFAAEFPFGLAGRSAHLVREGENAAMLPADLARSALGYASCRVPARFLYGKADIVVNNLLHARPAARLMPNAEVRSLAGLGHMLHHFRPDEVVAAARSLAG